MQIKANMKKVHNIKCLDKGIHNWERWNQFQYQTCVYLLQHFSSSASNWHSTFCHHVILYHMIGATCTELPSLQLSPEELPLIKEPRRCPPTITSLSLDMGPSTLLLTCRKDNDKNVKIFEVLTGIKQDREARNKKEFMAVFLLIVYGIKSTQNTFNF